MVNFSSLHDEGRPVDVFYHHRRDTLVNALQMAVSSSISDLIMSLTFTYYLDFAGSCSFGHETKKFVIARPRPETFSAIHIFSSGEVDIASSASASSSSSVSVRRLRIIIRRVHLSVDIISSNNNNNNKQDPLIVYLSQTKRQAKTKTTNAEK
jgi:hypothetical protein